MRRQGAKIGHSNALTPAETKIRELSGQKSPQKTPYLGSSRKPAVCKGWVVEVVGLKLVTHHPVIEPVSARAGNGNFQCRDRPAKAGSSPSRDGVGDAQGARKPPFPRYKCEKACESLSPTTGWWCAQSDTNRSPSAIPC
jgi:hypothetical protein